MDRVLDFERALLALDRLAAQEILAETDLTAAPIQGIDTLVVPALERIGRQWEQGNLALSQVYMSGRICEELIGSLLPEADRWREDQPRMAITVLDDYHLLGKRLVRSILQASGFAVMDYGRTDSDQLVDRAHRDGIEILLISTLMLPSALRVEEVRARLDRSIKIVVGGAPFRFDDHLWQAVGADAVGRYASEAVAIVEEMAGEGT